MSNEEINYKSMMVKIFMYFLIINGCILVLLFFFLNDICPWIMNNRKIRRFIKKIKEKSDAMDTLKDKFLIFIIKEFEQKMKNEGFELPTWSFAERIYVFLFGRYEKRYKKIEQKPNKQKTLEIFNASEKETVEFKKDSEEGKLIKIFKEIKSEIKHKHVEYEKENKKLTFELMEIIEKETGWKKSFFYGDKIISSTYSDNFQCMCKAINKSNFPLFFEQKKLKFFDIHVL